MKKKLFKGLLLTMMFTAMLSISALAEEGGQREEVVDHLNAAETYQTSGVQEYITAEEEYSLDSTHSIHFEAVVYVDYTWDEGAYGWFNDAYTYSIWAGSDNVYVDNAISVGRENTENTENTYCEKFKIYCMKTSGYDYSIIYMKVHARVDEWGNVDDVWLTFANS